MNITEMVLLLATGYAFHLYYNLIGHFASLRGVDFGSWVVTPLDSAIPYMPFWVWFYQLAYVAPVVLVVMAAPRIGRDMRFCRQLWISFLLLLVTHYSLYLLLPVSAQPVRLPDGMLGHGTSADLVRYQYTVVTQWNAWPSLHVSACWFFYRSLAPRLPRWGRLYLVWFWGMVTATVAIKIHYVLDGLTGLLVAESVYRFVLRKMEGGTRSPGQSLSSKQRLVLLTGILIGLLGTLTALAYATGFGGPVFAHIPLDRLWSSP